MSASELAKLSVEEMLGAFAACELSAAAATEHLLKRIARLDPQIGAVTEILAATARWEAAAAGALREGPGAPSLAGVPVLIKDIIDTVPAVCSAGLPFLGDYRPTTDAPVVRRLREAGAVVLASRPPIPVLSASRLPPCAIRSRGAHARPQAGSCCICSTGVCGLTFRPHGT